MNAAADQQRVSGWVLMVGGALVALLVGALLVPRLMDWSRYRAVFEGQIEAVTGREATIAGPVRFALLPRPAFSAHDVRVASIDGAASRDLVAAPRAHLPVSLPRLLMGKMRVTRVVLSDPVIELEILPGGRRSWEFDPRQQAERRARAGVRRIALRALGVRNATLVYRRGDRSPLSVTGLDLDVTAAAASGPVEARGRVRLNRKLVRAALWLGRQDDGERPFVLKLHTTGSTVLTARGSAVGSGRRVRLDGTLEGRSRDLEALLALARVEAAPGLDGRKATLQGRLRLADGRLSLSDLDLRLADMRLTGTAVATMAPRPAATLSLASQRLDLDALAGLGRRVDDPPASGGPGIDLDLRLSVETAVYRGAPIRKARLEAAARDGVWRVGRLEAVLPGESVLSLRLPESGTGRLSLVSSDPRALVAWAGLDVADVPKGRLAALDLRAEIGGDARLMTLDRIVLKLDDTTLRGWLDYGLAGSPFLTADLAADRLDLDAYGSESPRSRPVDWGAFGFLGRMDADAALSVARLRWRGLDLRGATADLALKDGVMTVRRLGAEGDAGAAVSLAGTIREFGRPPRWKLAGTARAARLGDLLEGQPGGAFQDSPVDLALTTEGNPETSAFSARGTVGGAGLSLTGESRAWGKDGRERVVRVDLRDSSWDRLASHGGLPGWRPLPGHDGPVSLQGSVVARGGSLTVDLSGALGGGRLVLKGSADLTGAESPVDLSLLAHAPEAQRFLRGIGVHFRPTPATAGGFLVQASLKGPRDRLAADDLRIEMGPARLTGTLRYQGGGPRPRIEAALQAGDVDLDQFLPERRTGPDKVREPGGERWSREPLGLDWLRAVDGRLMLTGERLHYRRYAFLQPSLAAALDDGRLRIERLDAGLFGGRASVSGQLDARGTPRLTAALKLEGASLEQALERLADARFASGTLRLEGTLAAAGDSQRALVESLEGKGTIEARDGVVRGLDVPRLSRDLADLSSYDNFLGLAETALDGGQTRYGQASGSWRIERGVLRADDFRMTLDQASGTAVATVDLPEWTVDLALSMRLTAPGLERAPPVGLVLYGPIEAPERDRKLGKMGRYVGKRLAREVLRDALGEEDETPEERAARKERTRRVVDKLIDKVTKKRREAYPE